MKNFRDYLSESEQAADTPVAGDTFAINIREECLIESVVVESRDDGVVIAADEGMMRLLESYGYTFEENCMECGMMECGCGQDPEEYGDETDAGQDPGEYDYEGDMAKDELMTMIRSARKLIGMLDNDDNMPEWTQKKINKATDYVDTASDYISSKKERGVMEQSQEDSPVARATLHRIMMRHPGMLAQHGPERVMKAVDDVADLVGDMDDIGSSDISGWVNMVQEILDSLDQGVAEGSLNEAATMASVSKLLRHIERHNPTWFDDYGMGEVEDTVVDMAEQGQFSGMTVVDAAALVGQELESMYGANGMNEGSADLTDIWQAGREAAYSGKSMTSCPHKMFSKEWEAWQQGWQDQKGSTSDGMNEAEYQGRKVPLGKPMQGDVAKSKVYVRDPKTGNVKKVNFGDPNMKIKKSNPARRKSFRARHNCDNPGPRTKARYWSCRAW